MINRRAALTLAASLTLGLAACSPEDKQQATRNPIAPDQAFEAVAAQGRGFSVGALMSANPVYVLFDPQCPHCARLWNAAQPLQNTMKFVWIPVSLLGAKSLPQGAALLQASDPIAAMTAHEQSLLAGQGGMSASASVPDDIASAIKANTQLLDNLGATSVPYIVARHARSGAVVTHAGAMDTDALRAFLGMGQP
jgi:thiol:disulfide interchange protein DsbG